MSRLLLSSLLLFVLPSPGYAYPITSYLEMVIVSNVKGNWKNVPLDNSYTNPVIACTYNLPSPASNEAVIRVRQTGGNIQIKAQRPMNSNQVTTSDVYCIVSEEGSYTTPIKYEAHTVSSSNTNNTANWSSTPMQNVTASKVQNYNNPVVIGQVMSYNNSDFSAFWSSNGNRSNPPTNNAIYVGKHTGQATPTSPTTETLGYFIAEQASYTLSNARIRIALGADSIQGVGNNPPYNYTLGNSYSYAVATQSAMDGGHGGWAVLYGNNPVSTTLSLGIDEETVAGDKTRTHITEQVAYWVMEPIAGPNLTLSKTVSTIYDPYNGASNPKAIPGSVLEYTIEATNTGSVAADNNSIRINDAIPANTTLCVSSTGNCLPPQFINGATSSGLSLASISYSDNGGGSYGYTPTADSDGADTAITHLLANMNGSFAAYSGSGAAPSFSIRFRIIVE